MGGNSGKEWKSFFCGKGDFLARCVVKRQIYALCLVLWLEDGQSHADGVARKGTRGKVTQEFSDARCEKCGGCVGFEDGMRQDFCLCDPWCACCGRQFIASPGTPGERICDRCNEEEVVRTFSDEFLKSLNRKQMSLLARDISRKLEKEA